MTTTSGVTEEIPQRLRDAGPVPLPDDHPAFLRWSDGADGLIGPNVVQLWSAE